MPRLHPGYCTIVLTKLLPLAWLSLAVGCAQRPVMHDPPGLAVGDMLYSFDAQERLTRHERAAQPADPVYTIWLGQFRIEGRADRSAWLRLDEDHWLQLTQPTPDRLARHEEWCLTPLLLIRLAQDAEEIGQPLGALPEALSQRLRRADLPARHEAANLAARLLGRSIIPFEARTQTHRVQGRLRLSESGRRMLTDALAAYYVHLRELGQL